MSFFDEIKTKIINFGLNFVTVDEKIVRGILDTFPRNIKNIVILPAVSYVAKKVISELQHKTKEGRVYNGLLNGVEVSVIRTEMGGPSAAVVMECLKRAHSKIAIRIDYCGALQSTFNINVLEKMSNLYLSRDIKRTYINSDDLIFTNLEIGDIIIPKTCILSDGACFQYLQTYKNEVLYSQEFRKYISLSKFKEYSATSSIRGSDGSLIIDVKNNCMDYPEFKEHYWSVDSDFDLYNIINSEMSKLFPSQVRKIKEDRLFSVDALFCQPQEAINTWKIYATNCVDMESAVIYMLGKLFFIKTASILSISDFPDSEKYNFQKSNEIHPKFFKGLDNALKILKESLPEISNKLIK